MQESTDNANDTLLRGDANSQLRVAAYEVLNTFVTNSANDNLPIVASLSEIILQRLEGTIPLQSQIVSVEDRLLLEEIQTSLASCTLVCTLFSVDKLWLTDI